MGFKNSPAAIKFFYSECEKCGYGNGIRFGETGSEMNEAGYAVLQEATDIARARGAKNTIVQDFTDAFANQKEREYQEYTREEMAEAAQTPQTTEEHSPEVDDAIDAINAIARPTSDPDAMRAATYEAMAEERATKAYRTSGTYRIEGRAKKSGAGTLYVGVWADTGDTMRWQVTGGKNGAYTLRIQADDEAAAARWAARQFPDATKEGAAPAAPFANAVRDAVHAANDALAETKRGYYACPQTATYDDMAGAARIVLDARNAALVTCGKKARPITQRAISDMIR